MLILLGPFNTRDCYYFESNLGMTFFTKASLTKQHVILQYPNYEESLSLNNLFLCLSLISLERYGQRHVVKYWNFSENIKKGIRLCIEGSFKPNFCKFQCYSIVLQEFLIKSICRRNIQE